MRILVTGGAGFIGSAVVRYLISETDAVVTNIDKLTYAGNLQSIREAANSGRCTTYISDICNFSDVFAIIQDFKPDVIMHLAAESHVDRSIEGPSEFIKTNVDGTFVMLEASRKYWSQLPESARHSFRFHHISTDEVFGDLGESGEDAFTEQTPYAPSSPYSATKASSDHLVRAWHRTFGLPTLITNCSNNYGPYHFPEKLIPHMILSALEGKPLPVYGNGQQIRDWLYVDDHARALFTVVQRGVIGNTYNIGGGNQITNLEVVRRICAVLDELQPPTMVKSYSDLIRFVEDRPGHDTRYAIDHSKISSRLGWNPQEDFESGLRKTVDWYLNNKWW